MAQSNDSEEQATYSKAELLRELRDLRLRLASSAVRRKAKKLSFAKKQEFVAARLMLTESINNLNAALMRDIRKDLEKQSDALREGIESLGQSLEKLQSVTRWAGKINGVVGSLGKVVSLL